MPRNGNGNFILPPGNPVISGTDISSSVHNTTMSDIASEISNSLAKDGQTVPTGNLPMGGFKHTGVSGGSSRNEYPSIGQIQDNSATWAGTASGTANAVLLTVSPAIPSYVAGQSFSYKAASTNTGNVVISIGGLPNKSVQINGSPLGAGDHVAGQWYRVTYDGSAFQLEQISSSHTVSVKNFGAVGDGIASDQTAIVAAVLAAVTKGLDLYWPAGTYLINANLIDFWEVVHTGPGVIKRGASTFYISPRNGQENFLYVSAVGGDSAYDGLSAEFPFSQTQLAFNALASKGYLSGTWRIYHSAGTYTGTSRLGPANDIGADPNVDPYRFGGITQDNFIVIEGPDVGYDPLTNPWPLPSATFDNAGNTGVGLQLRNVRVLVKNLKFRDYVGGSSAGIQGEGCHIRTENVHTAGCNVGINSHRGRLEVKGGLIYGSPSNQHTGIVSIFLNKHEIGEQGAGVIGRGPKISFCNIGFQAQEGATGHSDYVQYEDCTDGIRVTVNSRVNLTGSDFKRCLRAVRCDSNGVIYAENPSFNEGTVDANGENIIIQQGGVDVVRDSYSNSCVATDYLTSPVTITGTVNSTPILSKTLPRGRFAPQIFSIRKPQHIRISAFGNISGTAGVKQFKVRLGSNNLGSVSTSASDVGSFRITGEVVFQSQTSQKGGLTYSPHLLSTRSSYGSTSIDMRDSDVPLAFEVQLVNAADSVTIDHCVIEVYG